MTLNWMRNRDLRAGEIANFAGVNKLLHSWAVLREDLERLSGAWLNDHIINAWLSLCSEHSQHRQILFHNSYFMDVLNGSGLGQVLSARKVGKITWRSTANAPGVVCEGEG